MRGGDGVSHSPCVECGTTNWYWLMWEEKPNGDIVCSDCVEVTA